MDLAEKEDVSRDDIDLAVARGEAREAFFALHRREDVPLALLLVLARAMAIDGGDGGGRALRGLLPDVHAAFLARPELDEGDASAFALLQLVADAAGRDCVDKVPEYGCAAVEIVSRAVSELCEEQADRLAGFTALKTMVAVYTEPIRHGLVEHILLRCPYPSLASLFVTEYQREVAAGGVVFSMPAHIKAVLDRALDLPSPRRVLETRDLVMAGLNFAYFCKLRGLSAHYSLDGVLASLARKLDVLARAVDRRCAVCDAPAPTSRCAACKFSRYCSRDCQSKHWKTGGHKDACRAMREMPEYASNEVAMLQIVLQDVQNP